jgi:hypothetical protein
MAHYRYCILHFCVIDYIEVLAIKLQAKYIFHAVKVLLFYIYMAASECSQNHFISGKYKTVQPTFKIVPLCSYTRLPVTIKVLETFLEAIL